MIALTEREAVTEGRRESDWMLDKKRRYGEVGGDSTADPMTRMMTMLWWKGCTYSWRMGVLCRRTWCCVDDGEDAVQMTVVVKHG